MGNAFRAQPFPALYGDNKTPVTEDVLEVGLLVAFSMIAFSFILIIPGIRGWEVSLWFNAWIAMRYCTVPFMQPHGGADFYY